MNCKSLVSLVAVAIAGTSLAVVTSTNTLCRIKVAYSSQENIVGIPLVEVGGSAETINVTNFVLTTGLPEGTKLSYKEGNTWYNWALDGNGKWSVAQGDTAPTDTFARGGAVVLKLPDNTTYSGNFFLSGQYSSNDCTITPTAGYNLIGNAGTTALTSANLGGTPANGDKVIFPVTATFNMGGTEVTMPSTKTYTYNNGAWSDTFSVPAGNGFWYYKAASN